MHVCEGCAESQETLAPSVIWQIKVAGHGLNRAGRSRWMKEILRRYTDRAGDEVLGYHTCVKHVVTLRRGAIQ